MSVLYKMKIYLEEVETSHTRMIGGSRQGRGERRGCKCYSAVIHN